MAVSTNVAGMSWGISLGICVQRKQETVCDIYIYMYNHVLYIHIYI